MPGGVRRAGHRQPLRGLLPLRLRPQLVGAARALKRQGAENLEQLLDKWFERHDAPAFAIIGDLVLLPGEDGFDSICITDGRGNLFGWHDSDLSKMSVIKAADADIIAAWRL